MGPRTCQVYLMPAIGNTHNNRPTKCPPTPATQHDRRVAEDPAVYVGGGTAKPDDSAPASRGSLPRCVNTA